MKTINLNRTPFYGAPQDRGNPLDAIAFNSNGQFEPVTDGRDSEACIAQMKEWMRCNTDTAMERIDMVVEAFGTGKIGEQERLRHALEERVWIIFESYVKNNGDFFLAHRCCLLILGYHTAAGAGSQSELVKVLSKTSGDNITKAAVNKCIRHFQKKTPEIEYFKEQRNKAARKRMADKRNNQLSK